MNDYFEKPNEVDVHLFKFGGGSLSVLDKDYPGEYSHLFSGPEAIGSWPDMQIGIDPKEWRVPGMTTGALSVSATPLPTIKKNLKFALNLAKAVSQFSNGRNFFAYDDENDIAYVEYVSSSKAIYYVTFCPIDGTMKAAVFTGSHSDGPDEFISTCAVGPRENSATTGGQPFSGVAKLMAIILGTAMAHQKALDGPAVLTGTADQSNAKHLYDALAGIGEEELITGSKKRNVDNVKNLQCAAWLLFGGGYSSIKLSTDENFFLCHAIKENFFRDGKPVEKMAQFTQSDIDYSSIRAITKEDFSWINGAPNSPTGMFNFTGEPVTAETSVEPEPETSYKKFVGKPITEKNIAELRGLFALDFHPLTAEEKALVPGIPKNYVMDEKLLSAAMDIKDDWKSGVNLAPNFILEGDAGSGKTAATVFFASVFGVPRTKMTMQPLFESSNLIGAFYPVFSDIGDWEMSDEDRVAISAVQKEIESDRVETEGSAVPKTADLLRAIRRAFSIETVRSAIREAYDIPSTEEIEFCPEDAWGRISSGSEMPETSDIILAADRLFEDKAYRLLNILLEKAENGSVSYRFILSELMKAFQHGWLVEIQEAASVLRPGVLTELNSLLEPNGRIELPNGQLIYRHPDTIVMFTTNRDYAGNVDLNESLRDRCMFGIAMDSPTASVMAKRAMEQTGFTDKKVANSAAKTILDVARQAKNYNINGSFGVRSLISWMLALKKLDLSKAKIEDIRETFLSRVVYKMTTRPDDVEVLSTAFDNSDFCSEFKAGKVGRE